MANRGERVDSHQHFWRLARGDYGWLTEDLAPIYRDFVPEDLSPHLNEANIGRTVLVQAAPTVAETRFMLSVAAENRFVAGVVGWIDMEASDAPTVLDTLAGDPAFKGIRPMIQAIDDPDWMLRPGLDTAFRALIERGLTFDALVTPVHLDRLHRLVTRYPDLAVVIDHGAKPDIAGGRFDDWAAGIGAIARDSAAFCKLSGLVTEADEAWTVDDLRPYVDHLLATFGPDRLMWGSDWPVVTLRADYGSWVRATDTLLKDVSATQRKAIFGDTARRFYNLD